MTGIDDGTERVDMGAAVTRSLLGWGVVAGAFYLVVGIVLGLTRDGFDLARHPLSLLMLGDGGWMQRANLVISAIMVAAAALGFARALDGIGPARLAGGALLLHAVCLLGSAVFAPDPMAGFPAGADAARASTSGVLHLAFGATGFVAMAVAAFAVGRWYAEGSASGRAGYSRLSGGLILAGFAGGAVLATQVAGILLLWVAVVAGWAWVSATSADLYRRTPHPDRERRPSPGGLESDA